MKEPDAIHDPAEAAALFAAGALPPEEAAALEARLDAGDASLAAELASYDELVRALHANVAEAAPPASVRERLLDQAASGALGAPLHMRKTARIRRKEPFVRRAGALDWRDYGVPGIQFCILDLDPARNLQSCLIRAEAGVEFPAHSHPVTEGCYVLEGDFQTHGTTLHAGDYLFAPAGSDHPLTRTEGGCMLLIVSEIRAL